MKNIVCLLNIFLFVACTPSIEVVVTGLNVDSIWFVSADTSIVVKKNDDNVFVLDLEEKLKNRYFNLHCANMQAKIFTETSCEINFNFNTKIITYEGRAANENMYIKNMLVQRLDMSLEETDMIASVKKMYKEDMAYLNGQNFSQEFVYWESIRLKYRYMEDVLRYRYMHARAVNMKEFFPKVEYFDFIKNSIKDDKNYFKIEEYRKILPDLVRTNALYMTNSYEPFDVVNTLIDYVEYNFESPEIQEFLIHRYIFEYIQKEGLGEYEQLKTIYDNYVFSEKFISELVSIVARWKSLEPGNKSVDLDCVDIDGNPCSIENFRGSYIYIDVWATWSPYSCVEIPHLEKLKRRYNNRNIVFISYSHDQDLVKWRTKVLADRMGGIQVNSNGSNSFINAYNIISLPHFILLDREGKIINANMYKPSSYKTIQILDALEGI